MTQQTATSLVVTFDGTVLPPDANLHAAVVDRARHRPDLFTLTFRDPGRSVLELVHAKVGARVVVKALNDADPAPQLLVTGEVTGLEVAVDAAGRMVVVRGYDLSHRLHRARTSTAYQNATYADVAAQVAKRVGLKCGTIDATTPVHDHIGQVDQSDADLLTALASEVGFEFVVEDDLLHFRRPSPATGSPQGVDLESEDPLQLVVGSSLLRIHASVTGMGQVRGVEARGWDPATKKALTALTPVEARSNRSGTSSAAMADALGAGELTVPALRLDTQAEVDHEAQVIGQAVGDSLAELEGTARGNPRLRPGSCVQVAQLGSPFDGSYVLSTVRHVYDPTEGFVSHFSISGREDRSLLGLGSASRSSSTGRSGVVPAIVEDADDPEGRCRVKLRFPWIAEDYVSDWARTVQLGAGDHRGLVWLSEPGDEVLVAFEEGDLGRPYVVGGLYNAADAPRVRPPIDGATKAIDARELVTRSGHRLTFRDAAMGQQIEIATGGGSATVLLDETGKRIAVTSTGDVAISATGGISIDATGPLSLHGATVEVKADTTLDLEGGAATSVKGSVIQLN